MRFRWGDCVVDREAHSLSRAGKLVPVQPLVLDLLLLLLRHRSRVVADEVIRRVLWPGVSVTDAALRRLVMEARRAIGDDGQRQEQIRTVRGRGVMLAPQVAVEDGWDTSFVGRGDLLAVLEQTLEAVSDGRGAVTLLPGPAGIGKTRTLAELAARAEARGFRVHAGSGRAGAIGEAFHPWLDAAEELGIDELLRKSRREREALSESAGEPELRQVRFREVARALARRASERPLLLTLDDLQFADADSLALLRFIAPLLRSGRVWVLGGLRSASAIGDDSRLADLRGLAADSSTQVVPLRRLAADELGAVVATQIGVELGAALAERLCARTEGNPFFALELARLLHAEGRLVRGSVPTELAVGAELGVDALLARRAAALAPETRRLLRAAAALGIEFDPRVLREAEGVAARALAHALDEATAAGLLDPAGRETRRFAHPLLAEALYAELAEEPHGVAAQHLRLAEALERLGRDEPFALARHFVASRPVAAAERVLPHARRAAEEARRRFAAADAGLWYRHAVELAELASSPEVGDLLLAEGEVLIVSGGLDSARALFQRAARLAEKSGDRVLLARAALAHAHRPDFLQAQASILDWLRSARDQPSGEAALEACVASRLGSELVAAGRENAAAGEALVREGESRARQLDEPLALARVLFDVNAATFAARDTRAWLGRAEELAHLALRAGDFELHFRGLCSCAFAHVQLGERTAAEQILESCGRFVTEHDLYYARALTHMMRASFAMLDGRFGEARAAIEAANAETMLRSSTGIAAQVAGQRFLLALLLGEVAGLVPTLEAIRGRFPTLRVLAAALALAHSLRGDLDSAVRELNKVIDELDALAFDWSRLPTLVLLAEVAFLTRSPIAAARLQPELAPYVGLSAVTHNATMYFGAVSQGLGWLAAARGRSAEAVEHFQAALALHAAMRSPHWSDASRRAIAEIRTGRRQASRH